jgi:hypothetical protein
MTKTLRILFAFMLIPIGASAQWQFQSVFPDTSGGKASPITNTAHGIAVDGEGKVWVGPYNSSLVPFTYPSVSWLVSSGSSLNTSWFRPHRGSRTRFTFGP